jgi:hypothetical protein
MCDVNCTSYAEIQGVSLKQKYRTVFLVIHPSAEITQQ